jgi:hypothetical protein
MAAYEKSFHSQKLTVDVAVRLKNKVVPEETGEKSWDLTSLWKVEMSEDADPQFTFENQNPSSPGWSPTDGDAVAKQFLNLKSSQDALAFFRKYFLGEAKKPDKDKKIRIRWSEIKSIQEAFLSALEHKPIAQHLQDFVFQSLVVVLQHDEKMLRIMSEPKERLVKFDAVTGIADCQDVLDALRAVTFLSRGSVWRRCANPKCEMFFKPERNNQTHHDTQCTHRAMANRYSEKTRKGINKRARKGKKGRKR